jgi:transposase-like protein
VAGSGAAVPNPEVLAQASRRRFTAAYKRQILQQADACTEPGQRGALLRREGRYSSHLTTWRRQSEQGAPQALAPQKPGPKATAHPLAEENRKLQRENQRLTRRLQQAELIIEIQKKASAILGIPLPSLDSEENG